MIYNSFSDTCLIVFALKLPVKWSVLTKYINLIICIILKLTCVQNHTLAGEVMELWFMSKYSSPVGPQNSGDISSYLWDVGRGNAIFFL